MALVKGEIDVYVVSKPISDEELKSAGIEKCKTRRTPRYCNELLIEDFFQLWQGLIGVIEDVSSTNIGISSIPCKL